MKHSFQTPERIQTCCCVAGGGPAGIMLGFLLARAGVEVVVLEKHADFFRDFRGDTIHPSTLEIMHELGLLEAFLRLPHQEIKQIRGVIGGEPVTVADFSHLPTRCRFIALMPQWDFLNFVAEQAHRYPAFHLSMESEVTDLLQAGERIAGVKVTTPQGELEIYADLVVGADGRHSTVRAQAGLEVLELGAPIDVLWLRLPQRPDDPEQTLGYVEAGRILIMINRGDYWQCGIVIPKGKFDDIRAQGLAAFQAALVRLAPFLAGRVDELDDWNAIKLLTVRVDRLRQWSRPGLLCVGDAAHAMSPVGGVGINLAIQDAVAAANILAVKLRQQEVTLEDLQMVQRRREWPTRLTQAGQVFIHQRFLNPILREKNSISLNWSLRLLLQLPWLRRIPARLVGLGIRPEHVKTPVKGVST
jgi:2-polyprenyl-6-methoxyphenol hydroxylase-like FAD-dependent oxidoreductase